MMIYQIYANVMVMIFFSRPRDGDDDISNICNCDGDGDIDADIFVFGLSNVSQERTLPERQKGTKSSQKSAATNQKITHELTQA